MLEWHEYVDQLLQNDSTLDGISLSFDENHNDTRIPPIVRSSILMLDKMIERLNNYNIIVFPERKQSIFIFTLMKLLHNITQGKIKKMYDPSAFQLGEKLKLGNAVVEFLGLEERDGISCMKIGLAESLTTSAPIEFFPLFQRTNTQRRLSKNAQFVAAKRSVENRLTVFSPDKQHLAVLADYKTHMNSSIFYMTSIISTKEAINNGYLCGKPINEILLIGQTDYTGTIRNIGAGQLAGIPSIVLAPDLYAILAAHENENPIQSIIIDASDSNRILTQIDALDDLMRSGIPITCVTDIVNSFDLQSLKKRGFHIWRWDKSSITPALYETAPPVLHKRIKNCATQEINYINVDNSEISLAIRKLSSHRHELKEASIQMIKLFETLNSLAFAWLRRTIPLRCSEAERAHLQLNEATQLLGTEKPFLSSVQHEDYEKIICWLKTIYSPQYPIPKQVALSDCLQAKNYDTICIIVPEKTDKESVRMYWQTWCTQRYLRTAVHVLYPVEYFSASHTAFSTTVVVGWLKRAIMRKTLFSFNTEQHIVLLYDCEQRWKNFDTSRWKSAINDSDNRTIIEHAFSSDNCPISVKLFEVVVGAEPPDTTQIVNEIDELSEIEFILRENKYRQYALRDGSKSEATTVEAIPVNYVGGFLAFYRIGHKVLSATRVITEDADKVDTLSPNELHVGDFIVVRETDRDLIKELADMLLSRSGKSGLRELATKWKEALRIEQLFSTPEEIYQKLTDAGCTRGMPRVRSWLSDDDTIAPQQKQDLEYIATVTESSVMHELLDQIYDAAQEVKAAHVQAGRILSGHLRSKIVEALENYGDIDPFNIWAPIEVTIEGIGIVRVLKIIDVGPPVLVNNADANRLIEE